MTARYDLIIIGAGSGGLTAAKFAAGLGAKTLLIEKSRIGGDCTWTGCIPSKSLLKIAKIAHDVRIASNFGIITSHATVDMKTVQACIQAAISEVYQHETPERLRNEGVEVILGQARFVDPHTVEVGGTVLRARNFLLATGAHPVLPELPGLDGTPYLTYETLFDNDQLPKRLLILGAGPVGAEMAQAYQRLGAQVTLIGDTLLPKDEPGARAVLQNVFKREGVRFVEGRADRAAYVSKEFCLSVGEEDHRGDALLVCVGRAPNVKELELDKAGVTFSAEGIPVNEHLQTNVRHIYAAGDCVGGPQFTHFAGWQAFQAARNALIVGDARGFSDVVPWCTFTDPEIAHVGLTEADARAKYGDHVRILRREEAFSDRAVCERETDGFIQIVHLESGRILGATIVAARAGEMITEIAVALQHDLKLSDLAAAIHAYPTYSSDLQLMASEEAIRAIFSGFKGGLIKRLSGLNVATPTSNGRSDI